MTTATREANCIWVRIDSDDDDIERFLRYRPPGYHLRSETTTLVLEQYVTVGAAQFQILDHPSPAVDGHIHVAAKLFSCSVPVSMIHLKHSGICDATRGAHVAEHLQNSLLNTPSVGQEILA